MIRILGLFAENGRLVLVTGLLAGILFPSLALAMKPWLPVMIAFVLFIAALRIGPQQALGGFGDFRLTLIVVLAYQIAIPVFLLGIFKFFGLTGIAATILNKGGQLLMVANTHLPYEQTLKKHFRSFRQVDQRDGFKILEAIR